MAGAKMLYDSLPSPTLENDWLGFCPGAVKLQNGDKKGALKKRTDYADSFSASGVTTYICAEKKCAFQGHVSVDFVWKMVMKDQKLGLQCRWAFLAKSHVPQSVVHGKRYNFQCPICIFTHGHAEGRIWTGVAIFLDHLATHRGKEIPQDVLHKLNLVNDYVCDEKENFDLNLWPTGFDSSSGYGSSNSSLHLSRAPTHTSMLEKVWGRKESNATTITEINTGLGRRETYASVRERDRADSVVAGAERAEKERDEQFYQPSEPWSAGLSVYHVERELDYLSPDF